MVFKNTVRIFVSTVVVCLGLVFLTYRAHAKDEESVRDISELAEAYLDNPTLVSEGVCSSYSIYQQTEDYGSACGNWHNGNPSCNQHLQLQFPPPAPQNQPGPAVPANLSPQQAERQQQPRTTNRTLIQPQQPLYRKPNCGPAQEGYTVNYKDISIIELIQFISKISGSNFIFDSADLTDPKTNTPFQITLVSEDSTSVADLSSALLQILKMYNLSVIEQGNNVLIYKNHNLSRVSTVITDDNVNDSCDTAVITRVFQLYNVQAERIAAIVKTLVSSEANVEASVETRHLIVTDITSNVNKIADLLAALDTPNLAIDVTEYNVKNANALTLAEYAQQIISPLVPPGTGLTLTPEPISQKIFIVATPFIINKALQVLESLDVPEIAALNPMPPAMAIENNNFYMYKLKYQNGREIADALREIGMNLQYTGVANIDFVNAIFSIQWLEVNNSIVVTGTDEAIQKVVELLEELDLQPKQVFIEVLVLDTTLENSLDFGVQWIALGDEQNKLAFASGLLGTPGTVPQLEGSSNSSSSSTISNTITTVNTTGARGIASSIPPATPVPGKNVALPNPSQLNGVIPTNFTEAFGLGFIGNIIRHNGKSFLTLGALLSALDEESDTTVVLNPRIMVEDNQPANFFVGQNIPYQTTSTVIQQTGSVTQNIQYEDIGVELQVIPTISPDNIVTLRINQTVATLATPIGVLTPTTNKELVTTRVHVPDGTFLVMSGQITDQCNYIRSGIPCLGSLPLIGPAFSRNIEQRIKRNLIFFIRPKVVTNIDQGIQLTNEEGYDYNWGINPCSIIEAGCEKAPESETYPNPGWPPPPTPGSSAASQRQAGNAPGQQQYGSPNPPGAPPAPEYAYPQYPYELGAPKPPSGYGQPPFPGAVAVPPGYGQPSYQGAPVSPQAYGQPGTAYPPGYNYPPAGQPYPPSGYPSQGDEYYYPAETQGYYPQSGYPYQTPPSDVYPSDSYYPPKSGEYYYPQQSEGYYPQYEYGY